MPANTTTQKPAAKRKARKKRAPRDPDKPRRTAEEAILDVLLAEMDAGRAPWRTPFSAVYSGPRNVFSGHRYSGANWMLLTMLQMGSPYWATRNQYLKAGHEVPKGLPDVPITFYKPFKHYLTAEEVAKLGRAPQRDEKGRPYEERRMLRLFWVVNAALIPTVQLPEVPDVNPDDGSGLDAFHTMLAGYPNPPKLATAIDGAYYELHSDTVSMPERKQFHSDADWCHVFSHELVHSTGHPSRLGRDMGGAFGSPSYALEELVAEIGSCFLMHHLQMDPQVELSAAYLNNWRQRLTDDPKLFLRAAAAASRATSLILPTPTEEDAPSA